MQPFNVMAVFVVARDRFYRVYADSDALYFLRIGGQTAGKSGSPRPVGGGAVAGLGYGIAAAIAAKERLMSPEGIAALDAAEPKAAIGQHEDDMAIPLADVASASLEPPSFLGGQGVHVGRLLVKVRDGKTWKLQFNEIEQMKTALEGLPGVLGDKLQVKAKWDASREKFVKD